MFVDKSVTSIYTMTTAENKKRVCCCLWLACDCELETSTLLTSRWPISIFYMQFVIREKSGAFKPHPSGHFHHKAYPR